MATKTRLWVRPRLINHPSDSPGHNCEIYVTTVWEYVARIFWEPIQAWTYLHRNPLSPIPGSVAGRASQAKRPGKSGHGRSISHRVLRILLLPLIRSQPRRHPLGPRRSGDPNLGLRKAEKTQGCGSARPVRQEKLSGSTYGPGYSVGIKQTTCEN